ncbi:MAG: ATP-binding protein [Gemmatimonadales bacterium]
MTSPYPQRLERLLEVGTFLTTELSLDGVLQKVVDAALELTSARYAALGVLAPDGRRLEAFVTAGISSEERARIGHLPTGRGVLGLLIRQPSAIRIKHLGSHPEASGFPRHHPAMSSFLGVPIVGRRGVFGNLYLTEKQGADEFSEEDEHIALLFASQAAAAIDNARLHEESAHLLEEVQQLHRSRERFFAMVNHELRNALAATYGWAEMLVRKRDPDQVPRAAYEVLESAGQAVSLINDLLDLSRLDEDRLRPVIQEVKPAEVTARALKRATPTAASRNIQLDQETPPGLPNCRTDANRVEQILLNIVTNAVHHAPEGSTVRTELSADTDHVVIRVLDEGPGVPAEEVERIFDIYVSKPGEAGRGIGLGLPLSRRLARLLGGDLRAIHQPGGGGCFILELPIHGIVNTSS